jgi:hypothetical protein
MSRFDADFSYVLDRGVLKIWDLDLGNRSVTNDAENVLTKIEDTEGRSFVGSKIMYRDSMGFGDGLAWDGCTVQFLPLHERSESAAYDKLLLRKTKFDLFEADE